MWVGGGGRRVLGPASAVTVICGLACFGLVFGITRSDVESWFWVVCDATSVRKSAGTVVKVKFVKG